MKTLRKLAVVIVVLLSPIAANADPITLTFDDICNQNACGAVPNGYGGLTWSGFSYVNAAALFPNSGIEFGTVSGEYAAFATYGNPPNVISSDTPFELVGMYLTSAFTAGMNVNIYADSRSISVPVSFYTPTYVELNWSDVTSALFWATGSDYCKRSPCQQVLVLDSLVIDFHEVPEPSTLALFGIGLAAMGLVRRKKVKVR